MLLTLMCEGKMNNNTYEVFWDNSIKIKFLILVFATLMIGWFGVFLSIVGVCFFFFGLRYIKPDDGVYYCLRQHCVLMRFNGNVNSGKLKLIPFFSKVIFIRNQIPFVIKNIGSDSMFSPFRFKKGTLDLTFGVDNYQMFLDSRKSFIELEEDLRFAVYRKIKVLEGNAIGKVETSALELDLRLEIDKILQHYGSSIKSFSFKDVSA